MPTPSGQITLNDIWIEPNLTWNSSESFGNIIYDSWATGPLGSNVNSWNGWGNDGSGGGVPIGGNVIYNVGGALQRGVDPINFGNYSNKYYYFDGTTYNIKYSYTNTKNNIIFPPPGVDNNVTVEIRCYDYLGIYNVHNSFIINVNGGTSTTPTQIPGFGFTSPLVSNVYWWLNVTASFTNTISNIAFSINGTTVVNTGAVSGGTTNFTWTSTGATQGYTNNSGILYDIYIS